MRNYIVCLLCVICSISYGQTPKEVVITDLFSKKNISITVKEDWKNEKIYIINRVLNSDSIVINEAGEVESVIVRLKSFLEVVYKVKGGSGEHLRATKVFSVNKGLLKESLSLLTLEKSYSPDGVLQENYTVKINLAYKKGKYTANLIEKNKGVIKKSSLLQFDKRANVFFCKKKNNEISICESNNVIKDFYQVSLSENDYIYYQGCWYQQGQKCYIKM